MSGFLFSEALLAKQLGVEVSDLHISDTYKGGRGQIVSVQLLEFLPLL